MQLWTRSAAFVAALLVILVPVSVALGAGQARGLYHRPVCGQVVGPHARCASDVRVDAPGAPPLATTSYQSGYAPADVQSAYNVASAAASAGGTQTVAIVDAFDDPNAEADLAAYRTQFSLGDCPSTGGCFRKVNQNGGTTPPAGDTGWAQEISLDLDMVSATCPKCHILLVEATTNSYADLAAAVDEAATLGATQVSNSYGGSELFGSSYESHYNHAGIDITVSSGDSGYGVEFPASSPHVTAVGGTHLVRNVNVTRGWSETVWSGAGSGCSGAFAKPSWQHDTGCSRRTVADLAAVADPNTGVAVYDSYGSSGGANWYVFGGTSVAAPIIAAVDALAGGRSPGTDYGSFPYNNASLFNDVISGSNGSCSTTYLCTGVAGYDGPTGMGTPAGVSAPAATDPPANVTRPNVNGTATEGQTLSTDNGTWTNSPTSFAYQWQSCPPSPASCVAVGATSTYSLQHSDVGNTITVTVTASNSAGPSAPATSDPTAQVAALPADFTISVSPSSRTIRRGTSTTYTVTVSPNASFSGGVSLTGSGGPTATGISFSPQSTTSTSTMTVTTSSSAPQGSYPLTITGTGNGVTHQTTATLTIRKR